MKISYEVHNYRYRKEIGKRILKDAKDKLDLGLITQEEFDKLKKKYDIQSINQTRNIY